MYKKLTPTTCTHPQSNCFLCTNDPLVIQDAQMSSPSRRSVLKGAFGGALGLSAGLVALGYGQDALAQSKSSALIDTHHHFYPPEYHRAWIDWENKRGIPHFAQQEAWTLENAFKDMDKAGVSKAILSLASTPGVWFDYAVPEINKMVRLVNDHAAKLVKDYPNRFGMFATLTMVDVPSTLKEIEYVFDVLGADGVGLQTNYGDKWPGHADFAPIFAELNRRKAVVYFHPLVAACCGRLSVGTYPAVIEVPHDTTRAVVSLLLSGSLAKFRDIKWIFSHGGGTIPMLAGRINFFHGQAKNIAEIAPNGIEAEFKRLFYDTANATHPSSMAALLKLVPSSQVTYGSDYPYVPMDTQIKNLEGSGLEPEVLEQIKHLNAERILKK